MRKKEEKEERKCGRSERFIYPSRQQFHASACCESYPRVVVTSSQASGHKDASHSFTSHANTCESMTGASSVEV